MGICYQFRQLLYSMFILNGPRTVVNDWSFLKVSSNALPTDIIVVWKLMIKIN